MFPSAMPPQGIFTMNFNLSTHHPEAAFAEGSAPLKPRVSHLEDSGLQIYC
jgi:hypothetical protein